VSGTPDVGPGGSARFSIASYGVSRGDAVRDRDRVLAVWRRCGADYSPEFNDGAKRYDWFYRSNPAGLGQLFFLEHRPSGETVGFAAIGARDFRLNGRRARAGLLVDFVIDRQHRVFFPALAIQRAVMAAARHDFEVLIGHPNESSGAVLRRAGGFQELEHVRYVRVLDFSAYLARYLPRPLSRAVGSGIRSADRLLHTVRRRRGPRIRSQWRETFDARYDEYWARADASRLCAGVRDRTFLEWRFRSGPRAGYRVLEIMALGSDALEGFFVCEFAANIVSVCDLWLAADAALQRRALLELSGAARALGARSVSIGLVRQATLDAALKACGFREREVQPVLVAVTNPTATLPFGEWHLTLADADV
jgi:hypothetical protein